MSYLYQLGHNSYEGFAFYGLSCELHYTQEEFDKLIIKCSQEVYDIISSKINTKHEFYKLEFSNILPEIVSLLIEKYYFSEINYDATFTAFGWGRVDKNDWKEASDNKLKLIRKQIITNKFKKSR